MPTLKVSQLYIYPIKSLRGVTVPSAPLTVHGLPYDRRFMLLKDHHDAKTPHYENMHVATFAEMCLFTTALKLPDVSKAEDHGLDVENGTQADGEITVTYTNPIDRSTSTLTIPLEPDTKDLENIDVTMHQSEMTALRMPDQYSAWFSERFGFNVVLAYLGPRYRSVLGNIAPNAAVRNPIRRAQAEKAKQKSNGALKGAGWLNGFVNSMPGLPTVFSSGEGNTNGDGRGGIAEKEDYEITFADCSPYLMVSKTSLDNVSERLAEGQKMDMEKFRPNIVVEGADEAWDEDYWAEVQLRSPSEEGEEVTLQLTANCVRCTSLTVDHETGKFGTGPGGNVLKLLQKDRRIDMGHKYSPVFGRYAFLPYELVKEGRQFEISTGDEVEITKRNQERTVLMWPGIGQTKMDNHFPVA